MDSTADSAVADMITTASVSKFLIKQSLNDLENYSRLWSFLLSITQFWGNKTVD